MKIYRIYYTEEDRSGEWFDHDITEKYVDGLDKVIAFIEVNKDDFTNYYYEEIEVE